MTIESAAGRGGGKGAVRGTETLQCALAVRARQSQARGGFQSFDDAVEEWHDQNKSLKLCRRGAIWRRSPDVVGSAANATRKPTDKVLKPEPPA